MSDISRALRAAHDSDDTEHGFAVLACEAADKIDGLTAALGQAQAEVEDYRALLALQWTRMVEATELWRQEDPVARALVMPDLGELLAWLMARIDKRPDATEKAVLDAARVGDVIGANATDIPRQCA